MYVPPLHTLLLSNVDCLQNMSALGHGAISRLVQEFGVLKMLQQTTNSIVDW